MGLNGASALYDRAPLVIVDNNLLDHRGHHLSLARVLAGAALDAGRNVVWYTHRKFQRNDIDSRIDVRPVFAMSTYEPFAMRRADIDLSGDFVSVFGQCEESFPDGATLLIHTADAHVFRALRKWFVPGPGERGRDTGRITYHIGTCYDLGLLPGSAAKGEPVPSSLFALTRSPAWERQLFFWAETERLAEYYRRAFATSAASLPLPAPPWTLSAGRPQRGKLTAVFLGAAREEKGFLKLSVLAAAIDAHRDLRKRMKLRVQCSEPLAGYSPAVRKTLEVLSGFSFVELFHGTLDADRYASEFLNADVILMMYVAKNYLARGSGIAIEALCAGKYMLCSKGMFIDSLDHQGLALAGESIPEWLSHLERLCASIQESRRFAKRVGAQLRSRYRVEAYLDRLALREAHSELFRSSFSSSLADTSPVFVRSMPDALRRQG
jgi:hypothetical protein